MTAPKPRSRVALILAIVLAVLAVTALALFAARRTIAREALVGWLKSRGIASEATIGEIGLSGVKAGIRVGDPKAPDLIIRDVDVRYRLRGLSVEVEAVTLRRAVLRARLHNGQFSVGALDPLVAEFLKRPPPTELKLPRMVFEDAVVALATDYGPVRVSVDALVDDSKLKSLTATTDPMRLKNADVTANVGGGRLTLATQGDRTAIAFTADVAGIEAATTKLGPGRLSVQVNAPYPDIIKRRGDGALSIAARLTADRVEAPGGSAKGLDLALGFTGQATGWIPDLALSGRATAALNTVGAEAGAARVGAVKASMISDDLRWSRAGGDRITAPFRVTATTDRVMASDLTLTNLTFAGQGALAADAKGSKLTLGGSAVGHGRWTGLGPPAKTDAPELAAVKRAAQGFAIKIPNVSASLAPTASVRLTRVEIRPDRGGLAQLDMAGSDAGRLKLAGGGLPAADLRFSRLRLVDGGGSADLDVTASASLGAVEGGRVSAAGHAAFGSGGLTFAATRCVELAAARLAFGEQDVKGLGGRFCPTTGPLFASRNGGWRLAGRAEGLTAAMPGAQVRIDDGALAVVASGRGTDMTAHIDVTGGRVRDTAAATRFNPLVVTGKADLARDVMTADLAVAVPAGTRVATLAVRHEVLTGKGGVQIDTGALKFADGGLQPAQLSPLVEAIGSPATGQASFAGFFAWEPGLGLSFGTLKIATLDFKSPAGFVTGLAGEVVMTSLAPLVIKDAQTLKATRLDALVPFTDVTASVSIGDETLRIAGAQAAVEGGIVKVESLEIPFAPGGRMKGVLSLEGVQLAKLVEASPFGSALDLDAKVSGRIPFELQAGKVKIAGGDLKAIQAGRLSINRQLFEQAGTVAPGTAPDPNDTFRGLAYQAMEDLAFDELSATLNSQADGRMGVLFHIVGRHDPPKKAQIKLTVMDLIKKRFLGKPLPLPSGTKVNLTLDTSLNLDQLLADYAEVQKRR